MVEYSVYIRNVEGSIPSVPTKILLGPKGVSDSPGVSPNLVFNDSRELELYDSNGNIYFSNFYNCYSIDGLF